MEKGVETFSQVYSIKKDDHDYIRELATFADAKMRMYRRGQAQLTHRVAILTALTISTNSSAYPGSTVP
jgi:cell division protein ZapA (FtsZ GTPase activity inhibitor)